MLHLSESRLFAFSALVFQTVPVLVILHSSAGHLDLICSHQPIIALAGDDVILPCCLEPATSATEVEWTKPGVHPKYVHVHQDGRLLYEIQNPSYHFRTRLFVDELEQGNVSMKISTVRVSDEGKYRCFIPSVQGEAFVHLSVGSVSSPVALVTNSTSSGVVLQCESEGWYPEPEVSWLDGEGNLLPAGPTETVRGPDGLYTVSSRVTVEKRHSNSFTCRVQQKDINQTRETHIQVPDDFFMIHTTSVSSTFIFGLVAGIIILILTAALFMWKRRRKKTKTKGNQRATDGTGERKNQPRSDGNELQSLAEGEETEKPRTENTESEHGRGKNENQTCTEDIVSCCREGRTVRTARGRGKRQL